jgi:site-specific DNA-methyltransferase (adenine-specific)
MCALIEKHSNEGDVVMDTFLGGGTTAYACKKTKRKCIGCEISPEYFSKMNTIMSTLFGD